MPVSTLIQNSFTSGELDPKLRARSDIAAYYSGAAKLRNVFVNPQGAARRRPGLEYKALLPTGPLKMIPFVFSRDETYLLILTSALLSVYKRGYLMTTVACAITADQIPDITWAQKYDTLLVFHNDFSPVYFRRGSDTSWTTGTWSLFNLPSYRDTSAPAPAYGITITDKSDTNLDFSDWNYGDAQKLCEVKATSGTPFVAGDVGRYIRDEFQGVAVITAFSSSTKLIATVLHPFAIERDLKGVSLAAGEWAFEEVSISSVTGYPACGAFHQGRLWMAGTRQQPNSVWGSVAGNEENFNAWNPELADNGIYITTTGSEMPRFHQMHAGKHLFLFSNSGEFYIPVSTSQPITPENVSLAKNDSYGSVPDLKPVEVDEAVVFMRAGGKALVSSLYNFARGGYANTDLSLLASHIIEDPVSMAYRKQTSTDESDYVLIVTGTGDLAVLCISQTQEIAAWTVCETAGQFKAVGVDQTDMYFAVQRVTNGAVQTFLEKFNNDLLLDCAVINPGTPLTFNGVPLTFDNIPLTFVSRSYRLTFDGVQLTFDNAMLTYGSDAYSSVSGLSHLIGEEVQIVLDNTIQPSQVVNGDTITLERSGNDVQVGLDFPIVDADSGSRVYIESMPVEFSGGWGSSVGRKKRIHEVTVMLYETSHIVIMKTNRAVIRRLDIDKLDEPVPKITRDLTISGILGWTDEAVISCGQTLPLPMELLGMAYKIRV